MDPSGPFSLDFQFNDGSVFGGDGNNTVTVSDFNFYGGSWAGGGTAIGGASSASGVVNITDSAFLNEYFRAFTPGTSLSFKVSITTTVDVPAPDQFSFAILDGALSEISTSGPGSEFVSVDVNSSNPIINKFGSTPGSLIQISAPVTTLVPEPATYLAGLGALGMLGLTAWWKRR